MRVVLASSSKWRRGLFALYFPSLYLSDRDTFLDPDVDEKAIRDPDPKKMAHLIARAKMDSATQKVKEASGDSLVEEVVVITCDQIVVCEGKVREKPRDKEEARQFLRSYSKGQPAECINGLVVQHLPSGMEVSAVETATVQFGPYSEQEIEEMLAGGMHSTTAGGFALMDNTPLARRLTRLTGDVPSVEGLPIYVLERLIRQLCPEQLAGKCLLPTFSRRIKGAIFDMDGLLLDTERLYTIAQEKVLSKYTDRKFTWEVKSMMMGRKALEAVGLMLKHYDLTESVSAQDFLAEREAILDQLFPDCELLPGVERLLVHLKACKVPMAVATSSHERHYEIKTRKHRKLFEEMFDFVVTGDQVKEGKPHPEIFVKAQKGLLGDDATPEDILVFEDSPLGVQAGQGAGMRTVMVSEKSPDGDLKPDLYVKTMLYFLPEQFGLPPLPRDFNCRFSGEQ